MSVKATFIIWKIKRYLRSVGSLVMKPTMPIQKDLSAAETEVPPYKLNWKGVACSVWHALEDDDTTKLESYLTTYAPYFTNEKHTDERSVDIRDEHLEFLDELHSIAMCNMYSAGVNLREQFGLSKKRARTVMAYWMKANG